MKLANIYGAYGAWGKLAQLKMNPKTAYTILKYLRRVASEYEIVEKTRVALIHELTNTKDGEDASIAPNTSTFNSYMARFNEILDVEPDLKPCEVKLDDLIAAISSDQSNVLTTADIAALESFFS